MNFTLSYATFNEEYEKLIESVTIPQSVIVTLKVNPRAVINEHQLSDFFKKLDEKTQNNSYSIKLEIEQCTSSINIDRLYTYEFLEKIQSKVKSILINNAKPSEVDLSILKKFQNVENITFNAFGGYNLDTTRTNHITSFYTKLKEFFENHPHAKKYQLNPSQGLNLSYITDVNAKIIIAEIKSIANKNFTVENSIIALEEYFKKISNLHNALLENASNLEQTTNEYLKKELERIQTTLNYKWLMEVEKFMQCADNLITMNNMYAYYYLAKYMHDFEENTDHKEIFKFLKKVLKPTGIDSDSDSDLDLDPDLNPDVEYGPETKSESERKKHFEIYKKAKALQAVMYLDEETYLKIKGISPEKYSTTPEIKQKRIKSIITYALKSKDESFFPLENLLSEQMLGLFDNSFFSKIDFNQDPLKVAIDIAMHVEKAYNKKNVDKGYENANPKPLPKAPHATIRTL